LFVMALREALAERGITQLRTGAEHEDIPDGHPLKQPLRVS
jgi:hypothetical protein